MPEYLSPGVYIQEKAEGLRPMAGVSTANLGIIGWFEKGPVGQPVFISSSEELARIFGGVKRYKINNTLHEYFYSPLSVLGFFQNGGRRVYVVRIAGSGAAAATGSIESGADILWTFKANSVGVWGNRLRVQYKRSGGGDPHLWDILVLWRDTPESDEIIVEQFNEVQWIDETKENYIENVLQSSEWIKIEKGEGGEPTDEGVVSLSGGLEGTKPSLLTAEDLAPFDKVDEMLLLIAPEWSVSDNIDETTKALITYAESRKLRDCFVIACVPKGKTPQQAKDYMLSTLNVNSSYYAIYYPWIKVVDPLSKSVVVFPPEGYIAGCYARTDSVRNVAKAPAGITDGALFGIVGIERVLSKDERDLLYPAAINPIASERYTGIALWGARTGSKDPLWRYINVRRAFQYFEKSTFEATHWVVFEPNNAVTRMRVKLQLEAFLFVHFLEGYFAGNSPAESYFVICDETNNPPQAVEQGLLYVDIGLAIAKPAEFVVFRFYQKTKTA